MADAPYTYDFKRPTFQKIYGINCKLPTMPPEKDFVNFGRPQSEQKFKRTHIPDDLFDWQFQGEARKKEMEVFIAAEYHKRKNGIWIFIKGKKFYIPGVMYYFLNYWVMETGELPTFKICDLDFFLVWFHVVHDPKCYGLVDFKPRRIGDTEKALCIVYEYATRVRNVVCGMQSNTGEDIQEKFTDRLVYAHDRMVWFMKAINKGSTNPQGGLILDYPVVFNSQKAIAERVKKGETATTSSSANYMYQPLKSKISFKPSVPKAYNGKRLGRYYMDEFGMMEEMDPNETWGLVRLAQRDKTSGEIVGKALMTANVDEVGKAQSGSDFSRKSMDYAHQLYEESDLDNLDENGETVTGLYRILRTYKDNCPVDEFGFPMLEIVELERKRTIESLIKKRKMTKLFQYRRQNPENWDDVFLSGDEKSGMDVERLLARGQFLKELIDPVTNKRRKPLYFRADLDWMDNVFGGDVVMRPNPEGLYWFSHNGLPANHGALANARSSTYSKKPGNIDLFCMAVDPYEEKDAIERHPSMGGLAVRRLRDDEVDGKKVITEEEDEYGELEIGDPLDYGFDWETNKYVCGYLHRHADPNKFYEDALKLAIFMGTDMLIEKNKGGSMQTWLELHGFGGYIQERPEYTKTEYGKNVKQSMIGATDGTIETYFKLLKTESVKFANTIDIPIIIDQIATLNWNNRTKKDLAVACGWAHVAALRNVRRRNRDEKKNKVGHAEPLRDYYV